MKRLKINLIIISATLILSACKTPTIEEKFKSQMIKSDWYLYSHENYDFFCDKPLIKLNRKIKNDFIEHCLTFEKGIIPLPAEGGNILFFYNENNQPVSFMLSWGWWEIYNTGGHCLLSKEENAMDWYYNVFLGELEKKAKAYAEKNKIKGRTKGVM